MATLYAWCAASLLNLISWSLTLSYDLSSALCARSSLFVTSLSAFCSALATSFDTSSGDFDLLQPASARAAATKIGIRYSRMQLPLVVVRDLASRIARGYPAVNQEPLPNPRADPPILHPIATFAVAPENRSDGIVRCSLPGSVTLRLTRSRL